MLLFKIIVLFINHFYVGKNVLNNFYLTDNIINIFLILTKNSGKLKYKNRALIKYL